MQEQEKTNLHYKLIADICDHIDHDTEDLPNFKMKLKSFLKPADLAPKKNTHEVLSAMERRGFLSVGEYGKLKGAFVGFREDIIDLIKKTETAMGIDSDLYAQQTSEVSAESPGQVETMDPETYNRKIHCDLLSEINDHLCKDVGNLDKFKTRMKPYLKPQDLAPNKTFLDIAQSMEQRGLLKVGGYDILIGALKGDQEDIINIIQATLKKIKDVKSGDLKDEASISDKKTTKQSKMELSDRKRKESPSENDGGSITTQSRPGKIQKLTGEKFRKVEETALDYEEVYNIIHQNICDQIGNISIAENAFVDGSQGTGFRVGDHMVMSAYHVFKPRLDFTWEEIALKIRNMLDKGRDLDELKTAFSYYFKVYNQPSFEDKDKMAIAFLNEWRTSNLPLKTFDDLIHLFEDHLTLPAEITNYLEDLSGIGTITFGDFRKNGENKVEFKMDLNTPFYSEQDDVILVNLIVNGNEQNVPKALRLDKSPTLSSAMHIIGHPDNKRLQFDPGCIVYKEKKNIENDIKEAKIYCSKLCNNESSKAQVNADYDNVLQRFNSGRFVIFHSSRSIMQGASGSPGIVMDGQNPKVQTMLQDGHPHGVYNALAKDDLKNLPARVFFESGLAMKRLEELLSLDKLRDIRDDIFKSYPVGMEH